MALLLVPNARKLLATGKRELGRLNPVVLDEREREAELGRPDVYLTALVPDEAERVPHHFVSIQIGQDRACGSRLYCVR